MRKGLDGSEGPPTFASNFLSPFDETVGVIKQLCDNEFCSGIHLLFEDVDSVFFVSVTFWVAFWVSYKSGELASLLLLFRHQVTLITRDTYAKVRRVLLRRTYIFDQIQSRCES